MKKLYILAFMALFFTVCTSKAQTFDTLSVRNAVSSMMDTYPKATLQDVYKSFYQNHFGPEHFIVDTVSVRQFFMQELSEMEDTSLVIYEMTGNNGRYVRVYLAAVTDSLINANQLINAFVQSANMKNMPNQDWASEWSFIVEIILQYDIKVNNIETDAGFLYEASQKHQAVRHSKAYRDAYHPHYRIVERSIFERELKPLIEAKGLSTPK